jgi:hypothetical protein
MGNKFASRPSPFKGMIFEERYGKEKAERMCKQNSELHIGKPAPWKIGCKSPHLKKYEFKPGLIPWNVGITG